MEAASMDYYSVLGVSRQANPEELKKAYHHMARLLHKDKNATIENFSEDAMKQLNKAYQTLTDTNLRKQYDSRERDTDDDLPDLTVPALRGGQRVSEKMMQLLSDWENSCPSSIPSQFPANYHTGVDKILKSDWIETIARRQYGDVVWETFQTVLNNHELSQSSEDIVVFLQLLDTFYNVRPSAGSKSRSQSTANNGDVCIYDLKLFSGRAAASTVLKAFGKTADKGATAVESCFPRSAFKDNPAAQSSDRCAKCAERPPDAGWAVWRSRRQSWNCCRSCGNAFCDKCLFEQNLPHFGGTNNFCQRCLADNKLADIQLWLQQACRQVLDGDSLLAAYCSFRAALHLHTGFDNRILKFAAAANRPESAIPIIVELLQLDGISEQTAVELELLFAANIVWWAEAVGKQIESSSDVADQVLSVGTVVSLLRTAKTAYSEAVGHALGARLAVDSFRPKHSANDIELLIAQQLSLLKQDRSTCHPLADRLKSLIVSGNDRELIYALSAANGGKRPLMQAAFELLIETNFQKSVGERQQPLFDLVQGLYFLRWAKSLNERLKGYAFLEAAFWRGWVTFDSIGEAIIQAYQEAIGDGYALPYETIADFLALSGKEAFEGVYHLLPTPNELKPPETHFWQGISLENRNLTPIRKYEKAIHKNVNERKTWKAVDAALAHWDLLDICEHPAEVTVCITNSALWALQELQESCKTLSKAKRYGLTELILYSTDCAMVVGYVAPLPGAMKYYIARLCFCVARQAGLLTGFEKPAEKATEYLQSLLFYAAICPALAPPVVMVSEAILLKIAYTDVFDKFLNTLADADSTRLFPTEAHVQYFRYENALLCHQPTGELNEARERAMLAMLKHHGLSIDNVKRFIDAGLTGRDSAGWLIRDSKLLGPSFRKGFVKINGVAINNADQSIRLLVKETGYIFSRSAYVSWDDVATIFSADIDDPSVLFFSLDPPDDKLSVHPFQCYRYEPKSMGGSLILNTMFHTDYLLKQFAMGTEVSAAFPFAIRSAKERLLSGLPPTLAAALKSTGERGSRKSHATRMWIQADQLNYDIQHTEKEALIVLDDVRLTIRSHPLLANASGKLEDTAENAESDQSPDAEFCRDMTKQFDELCKHFAEFSRLKELCKLHSLFRLLHGYKENLKEQSKSLVVSQQQMSNVRQQYERAVESRRAALVAKLGQIKSKIPDRSESTIQAVADSLQSTVGSRTSLRSAVRDCLLYNDQRSLADLLLTATKPPMPTETSITSDGRKMYSEKHAMFQQQVANLRQLCSKSPVSPELTAASSPKPWVPAICSLTDHGDYQTRIYGGVLLTPNLKATDLPKYQGGYSNQLNEQTMQNAKADVKSAPPAASDSSSESKAPKASRSRAGRMETLREIMQNEATPSAIKGWLRQEMNRVDRIKAKEKEVRQLSAIKAPTSNQQQQLQKLQTELGLREKSGKYVRLPPGYDLAHRRGREARYGYDYGPDNVVLQLRSLHRQQHQSESKLNNQKRSKNN